MSVFADLVRFIPTLGGTTDWTYSSAVGGCQSPAAANVQNGASYKVYAVSNDLTQWEISQGAYNSGTGVFARTAVLYNSSGTGSAAGQTGAGSKINFSTVPQVSIVALAEDLVSGPGASTDKALARWNGTTGAAVQDSQITLGDTDGKLTRTGGILISGTDGNASPPSGYIGEYNSASASGVSVANATAKTVVSITVPAGDFDVWGIAGTNGASGTTLTYFIVGIGKTNNGAPSGSLGSSSPYPAGFAPFVVAPIVMPIAPLQALNNAPTPYYLTMFTNSSANTTAFGTIMYRRRS